MLSKTTISRERADRQEDAARYLRRKGVTSGLTRHSARHGNLKKIDRAHRIANGQRPERCTKRHR